MQILIAFITGLTTGGLSCLAVQGGLLASSVAHEVESSLSRQKRRNKKRAPSSPPHASRPILLFLAAKLAAYTLLGFLLGWLGSVLQLSPLMRAILQLAIGVFMLGTALRMLNVHPIFRYFAIEPPPAVTRYIRRTARDGAHLVTPLFLGVLTVLIPCGVTQAMMAVAVGTGNPLMGATIMFAFILGTSPVFFVVAYLATRLGATLESNFMRFVAVVVLVLGLVSIDSGLTLAGSPYSFSNLIRSFSPPAQAQTAEQPAPTKTAVTPTLAPTNAPILAATATGAFVVQTGATPQPTASVSTPGSAVQSTAAPSTAAQSTAAQNILTINVVSAGYQPNTLQAQAGRPLQLKLVTNKTYSCARAFVIPALNIQKILPETGTVLIDIPPQRAGSVLYFSCSMGMYGGQIKFG